MYGDSVHCYSCIDLLLQLQVDSTCITFIRPKAKEKIVGCTSSFNDNFVGCQYIFNSTIHFMKCTYSGR